MTKETYSVRVDSNDRQRLRGIPVKTIQKVLFALCEEYSEGMPEPEAVVFEVETMYIKNQIQAHKTAIAELEALLSEKVKEAQENKEIYIKEQKALADVWNSVNTAYFIDKSIRTRYDIENITRLCFMPDNIIYGYCVEKTKQILSELTKKAKTEKDREAVHKAKKLLDILEDLLDCSSDNL
jgi:hypothetical protein